MHDLRIAVLDQAPQTVYMNLRILKISLLLALVLFGSAGCDPAPGPLVEFRNSTDVMVHLYNDPLFLTVEDEIVLPEPDSVEPEYLLTFKTLKPGEKRRKSLSNVAWLPEEREFVVRAITDDGLVIFQRVMTVKELNVPDLVIDITAN